MCNAAEHAFKEKSAKLLILLSLRTIYFRTFQSETPCSRHGHFLENILNLSFRLFGIIFQAISGSLLQLVLFLVVYFVRHWVHLHLAAGILSLLSIPSFLIISESPRCTVFQNHYFFVQKMKDELELLHE